MKYKYNPPSLVKRILNNHQWDSIIPKILITFDDGPNPGTTEIILKELQSKSIKSVFFCVGENLKRNPNLVSEILSEGHVIGNHSYSHQIITKQKKSAIVESINQVQQLMLNSYNYKMRYFRPPHGRFDLRTNKILEQFGLKNIMWSLLTYDYKNDINIVKFAISKYLSNNSIIVLHDSAKSKNIIVDSINFILEETEKKNYQIGNPTECLKPYS